jgi:hypothetical protein
MKRVITLSLYTWREGGVIQEQLRFLCKFALGYSYCVNKVQNLYKFALNAYSMIITLFRVMSSYK